MAYLADTVPIAHAHLLPSIDQPVEELEGLVRLVDVSELTVVADDLGAAEPFEHGAPLPVVASVWIFAGVDEIEVTDLGPIAAQSYASCRTGSFSELGWAQ
jgi:hypothetical protein